jgi:hypothetical protein
MQLVATIAIVTLAAAYVLRAGVRTLRGRKAACGSGCGKCSTPAAPEAKGRISLPQV